MNGKRITIYHIAKELGMSASYVSRALNDHPAISEKIRERVKKKAKELKYKQNSHAANLRRGSSKTIGVIVPHINQSFFSEAIAGIEEACVVNNHSLIICQSHESFKQESAAIETLIHQNVDCILISISAETQSGHYLEEATNNDIEVIQFDRCLDAIDGNKALNDNKEASFKAVNSLIEEGYKQIAFIGGPSHIGVFKDRKEGYLEAIKNAALKIPEKFIIDNALQKDSAVKVATELLTLKERPDAFFLVSDHQALGVLEVANSLGIKVPQQLGVFGFANEAFTGLIRPTLSSIDQKSKELGKCAANLYFNNVSPNNTATQTSISKVIKSEIIVRESSLKSSKKKKMLK
jgi:LacI family transcriptional regulator